MTKFRDTGKKADFGHFCPVLTRNGQICSFAQKSGYVTFCIPGPLTCTKVSEKTNEQIPRNVCYARTDEQV